MARMVPVGMDFWASRRSPERLEPAMMPAEERTMPGGQSRSPRPAGADGQRGRGTLARRTLGPALPRLGYPSPLPACPQHLPPSRSLRLLKDSAQNAPD